MIPRPAICFNQVTTELVSSKLIMAPNVPGQARKDGYWELIYITRHVHKNSQLISLPTDSVQIIDGSKHLTVSKDFVFGNMTRLHVV